MTMSMTWCRYGLSGLSGVLLRHDFVEAVETLMRITSLVSITV